MQCYCKAIELWEEFGEFEVECDSLQRIHTLKNLAEVLALVNWSSMISLEDFRQLYPNYQCILDRTRYSHLLPSDDDNEDFINIEEYSDLEEEDIEEEEEELLDRGGEARELLDRGGEARELLDQGGGAQELLDQGGGTQDDQGGGAQELLDHGGGAQELPGRYQGGGAQETLGADQKSGVEDMLVEDQEGISRDDREITDQEGGAQVLLGERGAQAPRGKQGECSEDNKFDERFDPKMRCKESKTGREQEEESKEGQKLVLKYEVIQAEVRSQL